MSLRPFAAFVGIAAAASAPPLAAGQTPPLTPDIPKEYRAPADAADYVKREAMIPMRDGVKLYTVIVAPKGARGAPMILTRTPYHAKNRAKRSVSTTMLGVLAEGDEVFVADGYIRVYQDVRGKYDSEGEYVMTRPPRGPLNASGIDHATDAWDTIEWLVKNVLRVQRPGGHGSARRTTGSPWPWRCWNRIPRCGRRRRNAP